MANSYPGYGIFHTRASLLCAVPSGCRMVRPSANLTPLPHIPRPRLQFFLSYLRSQFFSFLPSHVWFSTEHRFFTCSFFLSCFPTSASTKYFFLFGGIHGDVFYPGCAMDVSSCEAIRTSWTNLN
jgi:hypothetical protein